MNELEFINAVSELNITLDEIKLNKLERYYKLLVEWNEKMNLTGITEKEQVYLKHFYDSLTLNKIVDLSENLILVDIVLVILMI
jgi:16S rRNA (guanine527-N7)-methyltransferase